MPAAQAIAILLPKLATTSFRVPAAGGGELTVGAANVLANTINNAITLFSVQEGPPATEAAVSIAVVAISMKVTVPKIAVRSGQALARMPVHEALALILIQESARICLDHLLSGPTPPPWAQQVAADAGLTGLVMRFYSPIDAAATSLSAAGLAAEAATWKQEQVQEVWRDPDAQRQATEAVGDLVSYRVTRALNRALVAESGTGPLYRYFKALSARGAPPVMNGATANAGAATAACSGVLSEKCIAILLATQADGQYVVYKV